jgi:AraC-like DNA-binding protein
MEKIETFCQLFYSSHYLPIAHISGEGIITVYSALEYKVNVFTAAIAALNRMEQNPAVFASEEVGLYGLIRIDNSPDVVIVGPVFSGLVSDEAIYGFMRKNAIPVEQKNEIGAFLSALPRYTYNQFLNMLVFLYYTLNGKEISVLDHFHLADKNAEQEIAALHTLQSVQAKEFQGEHGTYQIEMMMLDYIRRGETDKLNSFLMESLKKQTLQEGTLAENPLRQAKNLLIGWVTMVGKVGAIGGGMDVEEVYRLIDLYIQECEKAQSIEVIKTLQYNLLFDFTERVAHCQVPPNTSKEVFAMIQFIKNHTNDQIGIDQVAYHIGKSRAYITKRFRQEVGQTISAYIMQCKLNEARSLLRHSNMSIAEISNYLFFSSQSYFHNVFKKEYQMTPSEFRKQGINK